MPVGKEVGLVPLTNATHILMVANNRHTQDARDYASAIMRATPLTIFPLDRVDFAKVRKNPGVLAALLRVHDLPPLNYCKQGAYWGKIATCIGRREPLWRIVGSPLPLSHGATHYRTCYDYRLTD